MLGIQRQATVTFSPVEVKHQERQSVSVGARQLCNGLKHGGGGTALVTYF